MAYCGPFNLMRRVPVRLRRETCLSFSSKDTIAAVRATHQPVKKRQRKRDRRPTWAADLSWEDRLASVVTPLWRLTYDEQLEVKQKHQEKILEQLCEGGKITFPVLPILPSPVRDGYRNKSTFSVNRGVDGNPKTVGFYVGKGKDGNIVCVNGDHLPNMPEKHKQVARRYQEFIRRSSLQPCLLLHDGGHWREVTVRTDAAGNTMAIVYFHPQGLSREEVAAHREDLAEFFANGAGSACELDSLYFQESAMTRCTREDSPYQLLFGHTHIYEQLPHLSGRILPVHHRVIRALRSQPAIRRLVYVSCKSEGEAMRNFRELCCAPDPKRKLQGDAFSPSLAVPVDMFPHTEHCELVILFER
ncbi:tRNA (uracil-5-)-methyltransferase homolog B [Hippocampus comes]|uniref:tRNA (uracil-5-)-methyltransferase homolog B n=1 Tax=Hippocampus comes TaxID=109280 RepID=UPI00094E07B3|nr:PREDICTED: tRNA (uracil(54)-C(5))-methyltransferase homolog-B-like [Hippocampus comes]